jgi:tRNA A-37 threonylcarbamoyl transferase component Bud32/membrane-associated phospholipid phosphatase
MLDPVDQLKAGLAERYQVEREIGQGGMATVYLARDLKHERWVALKVLRPELCTDVGAQRFLREVKIVAGLQHPHILPIFDSGAVAGFLYYVMPYVPGQTLRERLEREGQLPLEDAVQIARDVANALSYAHEKGIVHRDIKPENILIWEGYAIVADFGIARALTAAASARLTQTGVGLGTPTYMSPEQMQDGAPVDRRADIYSLACVVYEMLAGQPPFTGSSVQAVIARHVLDPVPPLSALRPVPESVETAIERGLAKRPADRFSTAEQFVRALVTPAPLPAEGAVAAGPSFFAELQRRRVHWAAILYVAAAFGLVKAAELVSPALGFPSWLYSFVVIAVLAGFPICLVLAWMFDLTRHGMRHATPMRAAPAPGAAARASPPWASARAVAAVMEASPAWPSGEEATVPMRTPSTPRTVTLLPQDVGARAALLTSRLGLAALLLGVVALNWLETALESWVGGDSRLVLDLRHQLGYAVHWLEGGYRFEFHDVTNALAVYGYSSAYFFLWPLLILGTAVALARRRENAPFRVFTFAIIIDYALSLPFFLLFPVPERWAYSESGAVLLSDRWSSRLIEAVRPLSGLDNCFPSFHVSLTVVLVLVAFIFGLRFRSSLAALGAVIVLSTYVLGIHWLADIFAGLAVGVVAVALALRLNERVYDLGLDPVRVRP